MKERSQHTNSYIVEYGIIAYEACLGKWMERNKNLKKASLELSERYREGSDVLMDSREHREAYLAVRMPATLAAVSKVLESVEGYSLDSMKDLGAGPGTATLAALKRFPSLKECFLYEKDRALGELGKKSVELKNVEWIFQDLLDVETFKESDLTILSYVTNEIEDPSALLKRAWQSTKQLLVIIEPGTPRGFEKIRKARSLLIEEGAYIVAPCPHADRCPMQEGDWCHFSIRLQRTKEHKEIKGGERGFEDEKFSYVVFSKKPASLPHARILRHPFHHPGHTEFTLCTKEGVQKKTISRRHGPLYKKARKWQWGDPVFEDL